MAAERTKEATLLYKYYRLMCHQIPSRCYFLYGAQTWYPLMSEDGGRQSFDEAAGTDAGRGLDRSFYGNPQMGYKTAICQRDIAIYGGMALFCLLFCLTAMRIRPPKLILPVLIGVLPIAADGGTQLLGNVFPKVFPFRESDPLLRTVTGALFGFCLCWYLIPLLERSLQEKDKYDRS